MRSLSCATTDVGVADDLQAHELRQARGVYRMRRRVNGRPAYYAITSTGNLLWGQIRVVGRGEHEADVMLDLWDDLDAADPEGACHLSLVDSDAIIDRDLREPVKMIGGPRGIPWRDRPPMVAPRLLRVATNGSTRAAVWMLLLSAIS